MAPLKIRQAEQRLRGGQTSDEPQFSALLAFTSNSKHFFAFLLGQGVAESSRFETFAPPCLKHFIGAVPPRPLFRRDVAVAALMGLLFIRRNGSSMYSSPRHAA
jgi:hypothetical protein